MDESSRNGQALAGDRQGPDVAGLMRDGLLLERYRYPPGPPVVLPSHAHEDYQLNVNLDLPGGMTYRGAYHTVPTRRLAVVMPGEVHTPRDPDDRQDDSAHLTLYVSPETISSAAAEVSGSHRWSTPFFRDLVIDDSELIGRFARLSAAVSEPSSALERDEHLVVLLTELVARHADVTAARSVPWTHRAVRRARDYLHDHLDANVSLAELSRVSGVSPYHLTRLFSASIGMSPHAYQVHLRIERAKRLLLAGWSVSEAGATAGFFDLSHFTRHFRRHVGAPPGVYARWA